jgi:alpha-maltose-1-phosphate synthase
MLVDAGDARSTTSPPTRCRARPTATGPTGATSGPSTPTTTPTWTSSRSTRSSTSTTWSWPIYTWHDPLPPAKFVFDEDGRRGAALDSMVSAGSIVSGGTVRRSVLSPGASSTPTPRSRTRVLMHGVDIGGTRSCATRSSTRTCDPGRAPQIGVDPEHDRERFHVSDDGIVVIGKGDEVPVCASVRVALLTRSTRRRSTAAPASTSSTSPRRWRTGDVDLAVHASARRATIPLVAGTYEPWEALDGERPELAALRTLSVDLAMVAGVGGADLVHSTRGTPTSPATWRSSPTTIPHVVTTHSLEPLRPWKARAARRRLRAVEFCERTGIDPRRRGHRGLEGHARRHPRLLPGGRPDRVARRPQRHRPDEYRPVDRPTCWSATASTRTARTRSSSGASPGRRGWSTCSTRPAPAAGRAGWCCAPARPTPRDRRRVPRPVEALAEGRRRWRWSGSRRCCRAPRSSSAAQHAACSSARRSTSRSGSSTSRRWPAGCRSSRRAVGGIPEIVVEGETGHLVEFAPATTPTARPPTRRASPRTSPTAWPVSCTTRTAAGDGRGGAARVEGPLRTRGRQARGAAGDVALGLLGGARWARTRRAGRPTPSSPTGSRPPAARGSASARAPASRPRHVGPGREDPPEERETVDRLDQGEDDDHRAEPVPLLALEDVAARRAASRAARRRSGTGHRSPQRGQRSLEPRGVDATGHGNRPATAPTPVVRRGRRTDRE